MEEIIEEMLEKNISINFEIGLLINELINNHIKNFDSLITDLSCYFYRTNTCKNDNPEIYYSLLLLIHTLILYKIKQGTSVLYKLLFIKYDFNKNDDGIDNIYSYCGLHKLFLEFSDNELLSFHEIRNK